MFVDLPDCMYDYRPDIWESEDSINSDIYCERCGEEISNEMYDDNGGYCDKCFEIVFPD